MFANKNKAHFSLFVSNSSTNPSIPDLHFMCIRCLSIAHRSRVLPSSTPDFAFLCPPSADSEFSYFKIDRSGIDFHVNKVLAAAVQILANNLTRSSTAIQLDAERRAMVIVEARFINGAFFCLRSFKIQVPLPSFGFNGAPKEIFYGDWCSAVYTMRDPSAQHATCCLQ